LIKKLHSFFGDESEEEKQDTIKNIRKTTGITAATGLLILSVGATGFIDLPEVKAMARNSSKVPEYSFVVVPTSATTTTATEETTTLEVIATTVSSVITATTTTTATGFYDLHPELSTTVSRACLLGAEDENPGPLTKYSSSTLVSRSLSGKRALTYAEIEYWCNKYPYFKGLEDTLFEMQGSRSDIDLMVLLAHIIVESGGGTSYMAKTKNNPYGFTPDGKTGVSFNSKEEALTYWMQKFPERYIDKYGSVETYTLYQHCYMYSGGPVAGQKKGEEYTAYMLNIMNSLVDTFNKQKLW
jgi:hypothetical protein